MSDTADLFPLSMAADGSLTMSFGRNPNAPPGTVLKLFRSVTLAPESFVEILLLTPTSTIGVFTDGQDSGFFSGSGDTRYHFTDRNPPVPRAFY